jgi:hypothetical protein
MRSDLDLVAAREKRKLAPNLHVPLSASAKRSRSNKKLTLFRIFCKLLFPTDIALKNLFRCLYEKSSLEI